MATKKSSTTPAKRKKRSRVSSNSLKKVTLNGMLKGAVKPLALMAGFYGGRKLIAIINEKTQNVEGFFGIDGQKIIAPAITALVGLGAAQVIKDQNFKFVAYGLTAAAGIEIAKEAFNFDMLAGLGATEENTVALPPPAPNLDLSELEEKFNELDNEISGGVQGAEDYSDEEITIA